MKRLLLLVCLVTSPGLIAQPAPETTTAFNDYVSIVEARLARQHGSPEAFLSFTDSAARLRSGEFVIDNLTPRNRHELPGALLHHWRGTAFVPGATAAGFERLMKDFSSYPRTFAPEVLRAQSHPAGQLVEASMRVRQHHVLTVVLDSSYDVGFSRLDAQHGFSISRSTRIAEIASPGTPSERVLSPAEEHGFLWRLNTYWTYEERDGGLSIQIECVSLSRSIPRGLGWAVEPFVESIPRESLEFTLRSTRNALQHPNPEGTQR
jgi:hypothetical protein